MLYTMRFAGLTKQLESDNTAIEKTKTDGLESFDSDGFTVGSENQVNENLDGIVAWNWKAGTSVSGTTTGSGTGKSLFWKCRYY